MPVHLFPISVILRPSALEESTNGTRMFRPLLNDVLRGSPGSFLVLARTSQVIKWLLYKPGIHAEKITCCICNQKSIRAMHFACGGDVWVRAVQADLNANIWERRGRAYLSRKSEQGRCATTAALQDPAVPTVEPAFSSQVRPGRA